MCEYCGNSLYYNELTYSNEAESFDLKVSSDGKLDLTIGFLGNIFGHSFQINYCPMCGRNLKETINEL